MTSEQPVNNPPFPLSPGGAHVGEAPPWPLPRAAPSWSTRPHARRHPSPPRRSATEANGQAVARVRTTSDDQEVGHLDVIDPSTGSFNRSRAARQQAATAPAQRAGHRRRAAHPGTSIWSVSTGGSPAPAPTAAIPNSGHCCAATPFWHLLRRLRGGNETKPRQPRPSGLRSAAGAGGGHAAGLAHRPRPHAGH